MEYSSDAYDYTTSLPPGPTGLHPLPDMLVRLHRAPVVSIASIRGRATGVGSELALACDMRFASREKAILSHFEVGAGVVPGGGPMARLPRLMGRGRALEVLLGADDIPGDLAERYGYVNRSLPDAGLDAFVDGLATRIASFDRRAISETKRFVDVASLPPAFEIAPEWDVCLASIMRPAAQKRIQALMAQGFHKPEADAAAPPRVAAKAVRTPDLSIPAYRWPDRRAWLEPGTPASAMLYTRLVIGEKTPDQMTAESIGLAPLRRSVA